MNNIRKKVLNCLEESGIFLENCDDDDVDLREYIVNSILFISAVIAIEDEFMIELPTELLMNDSLSSLNAFCSMVEELSESP